nr:sorting nexin-6 [Delphinus delphis]
MVTFPGERPFCEEDQYEPWKTSRSEKQQDTLETQKNQMPSENGNWTAPRVAFGPSGIRAAQPRAVSRHVSLGLRAHSAKGGSTLGGGHFLPSSALSDPGPVGAGGAGLLRGPAAGPAPLAGRRRLPPARGAVRACASPRLGAAMMEGLDDGPDFLSEEDRGLKAINVDLQSDAALQVDISDALSERDKVKFTVHTKSSLPNFKQNEFSVVRQHEEFIWLHDSFVENEDYAGYIIPPAPPRPDFDASREKLQKLGEGEGSMTKEEFTKMKQELEAEYLAIFKKTVAMHEVFLCRVAAHPILRKDLNFHVFLEYNQDLSVRGKNKKEKLEDFFKNMVKSADGVIVSGVKDVDDFFEHERTFLLEYHNRVKDASAKSDRMTRSHKSAADDYNRIGSSLYALGTQDSTDICKFFLKVSELFDKTRKIEARVSADEDLKLSDLLKYYLRESQAAKDLLYRRSRSLVDYENANKALDKARAKNKDVLQAETSQQLCCQKFEKISESAKQELIDFKTRRVAAFRKNLVELAELELKHAKGNLQLLQNCLAVLNGDT